MITIQACLLLMLLWVLPFLSPRWDPQKGISAMSKVEKGSSEKALVKLEKKSDLVEDQDSLDKQGFEIDAGLVDESGEACLIQRLKLDKQT